MNHLSVALLCYWLCQVLHGIVPPGPHGSSAEALVWLVVKSSTPEVTLLICVLTLPLAGCDL